MAKVTGTNKDEGPSVKGPVRRTDKKIYLMTSALVEVGRSIRIVVTSGIMS